MEETARPNWRRWRGPAVLAALAAFWFWGLPLFNDVFLPRGLPRGEARTYEGLLTLSSADMVHLRFTSEQLLAENERNRATGRQRIEAVCVDPGTAKPRLAPAFERAARDKWDGRAVWARFTARPYLRHSACMQAMGFRSSRGGRRVGTHLDLVSLLEVRPLPCDSTTFVLRNRACPPPPRPPEPQVVRDATAYPDAARRRGAEGRVGLKALIGPKDELIRCRVVRPSGNAELDAAACQVLADRPELRRGPGSTDGLATGVRRLTPTVRFALE